MRNGTKARLRRYQYRGGREEEAERVLKDHALKEEAESKGEVTLARTKSERRGTRNY